MPAIPEKHIVTIHGFGFDPRIWSSIELAFEGYRVNHLGLPGFGEEPIGVADSVDSLALSFWRELDGAGVIKPHIIGHSMGGYVAMAMAARRPGDLASLTLLHSHAAADSAEKKRSRDITIAGIRQHGRDYILDRLIPSVFADPVASEPFIQRLRSRASGVPEAAWIRGLSWMRDRADHRDTLRSICCPVHWVIGLKDTAVSPGMVFSQSALPARVKLSVYGDCGHMSMYECPHRLMLDIMEFLARVVG